MTIDGLEATNITITDVVNVTGDMIMTGDVTVILPADALLHVENCLLLDEGTRIVVIVDNASTNGTTVVTYSASCSSPNISDQVIIEPHPYEECQTGRPIVVQLDDNGIARLALFYVPCSGDNGGDDDNGDNSGVPSEDNGDNNGVPSEDNDDNNGDVPREDNGDNGDLPSEDIWIFS